jgi:hypothetical protein
VINDATRRVGAAGNQHFRARGRVIILTEMDGWSASTRYRAIQHMPRLRQHFDDVRLSLPNDTIVRHAGRPGQVRYFTAHAQRYTRRGLQLRRDLEADALLVQRGLYVVGPGAIVRPVERFPGRVVFDLDDAVFELSPSLARKGSAARWLYGPHQALRLLRRADAIVVSTPALAEMLPPGLPSPTILPTVPDPAAYDPTPGHATGAVVIGWAGTVGGLVYLEPLREVFSRLAAERVAELEVVSSAPWSGPARFRRWTLEESTSVFRHHSIGIMPLPDTPYTRAKAGFKLLEYMASALPVVCSPVGINRHLIAESGGGLLADTPAEWAEALRKLAADPGLRAEMGGRGRAFVERYADLDRQATILAALLAT